MAQSAAISFSERITVRTESVPWFVWASVLAVTSSAVGGIWDISWHESIGRDTFWTAPHLFIQFGGVLAAVASAYLILTKSFSRSAESRAGAVRIWGFYGPLGAFVCCWGGVAMVTSAPFDNWWHNAYGLDVKILSPPHILLILGMMAIRFGAVVLILGEMNRAEGALRSKLHVLLLYTYTYVLGVAVTVFQEALFTNYMHTARFYFLLATCTPMFLVAIAQVSPSRWACTWVAGIFTAISLAFLWILPLFPAQPKLGPVYHDVTHFIPPPFPLLLIVPAFAMDLLRPRLRQWAGTLRAAALGAAFLFTLIAAQWPFAYFLFSPASRNWLFGAHYFPYFVSLTTDWVQGVFSPVEGTPFEFWSHMAVTLGVAMLSAWLGLGLGNWMRRVRR